MASHNHLLVRAMGCVVAAYVSAIPVRDNSARADQARVSRVRIVERGIYEAQSTDHLVAQGVLGPVRRVEQVKLVESTTYIPGQPGIRFGVRYAAHGPHKGTTHKLRMVTKFPDDGMQNTDGQRVRSSVFEVDVTVGTIGYREFQFDSQSEVILGEWVFEFWASGQKVGEQKFCIYSPEADTSARSKHPCHAPMSNLEMPPTTASAMAPKALTYQSMSSLQ